MMLSLAVFVLLIENICLLLGIIFRAKAFIRKYLLADNPGKTPNIFYTDTDTGKGCLLMSRDPADQASASVKSLVSFHRQWRGAPLTLNGLPLSDDKEGHCFSVLVVSIRLKVFLKFVYDVFC